MLKLGSKRLGSPYVSGRTRHWFKFKNPAAPAVKREAEEDWARRDAMTDLLLRQVAERRAGAEGEDDFDVIGPDGLVIGRIFKAATAPPGTPWMWTIAYGDRAPTHGYAATRSAAMQAFARSWHRE